MAEEQVTSEQEAPKFSKNAKTLGLSFVFFCIIASVVLFAAVAMSLRDCPDCNPSSPMLVSMMTILATLLFFLGISILTAFCRSCGKRKNSLTRTPRVVISSIPAEDLENSPARRLPYRQVQHRQPAFVVKTSQLDLPDYFTAIQNTGELNSSLHAAAQPPSYEEAVAIEAFESANEDKRP